MSLSLDSVTLNPDMVWEEKFSSQSVAQSRLRTLGGGLILFAGALNKGEQITLSSREFNGVLIGMLKKSVVDDVLDLAAVPGAQYVLTYNGVSVNVVFRHDDPPAVLMTPLLAKISYSANDLMRGQIKLLTV